jgi:PAS domain S-box-containing protein
MDTKEEKLAKLRQRAEASLGQNNYIAHSTNQDPDVLVEELQVTQLELELQLEDLQQYYQALESAQRRYNKLFDCAPIGYVVIDTQGRVITANQAAGKLLGLDSEALKDRVFAEFITREFQDSYFLAWRSIVHRQEAETVEVRLQRNDGVSFPVILNADMADDEHKEICVAITDISAVKQSEEALGRVLEQEKEVNPIRMRVLSVLSDEFRRPLTTILSSLELLHKHGSKLTLEKKEQLYQTVRNLVWYLKDTVQDASNIQDFEDQTQVRLEAFDVLAFTRQTINDMEAVLPSTQRIVLDTAGHQSKPTVIWNPNLFRRILMNLLRYTLNYSTEEVHCHLEVGKSSIRLRVEDQESSISREELQALFDAFYRGKNSEFIQGRGNGLFVVYNAVMAHGGTMRYEAREGGGINFLIELPRRIINPNPYRQ